MKPKTNENTTEEFENKQENETWRFFTPTKEVRINSTRNNDPGASRNMVTGVLNDSTNKPERAKIRSQSQPASKERPTVARILFATDKNDGSTLFMPKALTASLPTFDGKSVKFELFEDLCCNNIKIYPHQTEIQKKTNYFNPFHQTSFWRLPVNGKSTMRMGRA